MKKICTALLIALSLSSAAAKTYTRSCNAAYRVNVYQGSSRKINNFSGFTFKASASSSGYIPSTLRKRSYRKARDCLNAAMDRSYGNNRTHGKCQQVSGFPGNGYGWDWRSVANDACKARAKQVRFRDDRTPYKITIHGYVWGNKGCGGSYFKKSKSWHIMNLDGIICKRDGAYKYRVVGCDPDGVAPCPGGNLGSQLMPL